MNALADIPCSVAARLSARQIWGSIRIEVRRPLIGTYLAGNGTRIGKHIPFFKYYNSAADLSHAAVCLWRI
jgi:hypothetical protein